MSTIMPQSELLRNAIRFIAEGLESGKNTMETLLEQAAVRFNLSPKECDFLKDFYKNDPHQQD